MTALTQFAVDGFCPAWTFESPRRQAASSKPDLFPFPVWVEWPSSLKCQCGEPKFRVTDESTHATEERFGLAHTGPRWVCNSMGRVIE